MTEQTMQTTQTTGVLSEQKASHYLGRSNLASWCASHSINLIPNGNCSKKRSASRENRSCSHFLKNMHKGHLLRSFGLYGLRSDCDFMLWQASYAIEDLQGLSSKIRCSVMGPYLRETHAFLSMTKRSVYVGKNARGAHDPRLVITPEDKKYLFVYPFVKTRAWYAFLWKIANA